MAVDVSGRTGVAAGLSRVTVSAPRRRVDLTVPEHLPVIEVLPELLRHAGEDLADDGERQGGWLLRTADGAVLAPGQSLFAQGVRDGALLFLAPASARWPEVEFDDVVEAIADGSRRHGPAWSALDNRAAALAAAGVLLALPLLALAGLGVAPGVGGPVALAVALLLAGAGVAGSRAYGDAVLGVAFGAFALPYAFVGGALTVAADAGMGVFGALGWLGAPQLLVGSVAMTIVAVAGLVGVAGVRAVFVAGATAGALGVAAGLGGYAGPATSVAAVTVAALVCGIGLPPLLAIRLGRAPVPPLAVDATEGAGRGPDRQEVGAAVARTSRILGGLLVGHAVVCGLAMVVLATHGGLFGRLLVAVGAAALLLRARLFVAVAHRTPLLLAGLAGLAAVGAALVLVAAPPTLTALCVTAVVAAMATMVVGSGERRPASPYLGRLADLLDTLTVVAVIPVACAVLGLYSQVRALVG
ncbi:type VII secretion integral membrane protein EccD [Pilimelia columellifera]|uniref:Type VII secretion integral membrane protein EccD n=1 Tax=Pilimelia columellifera subsp. columellifera TaxID=706583 RepID=A0ABN3ND63_9ACTN